MYGRETWVITLYILLADTFLENSCLNKSLQEEKLNEFFFYTEEKFLRKMLDLFHVVPLPLKYCFKSFFSCIIADGFQKQASLKT